MLSGGGDFLLRVWSVAEGGCARTLVGHKRSEATPTKYVL